MVNAYGQCTAKWCGLYSYSLNAYTLKTPKYNAQPVVHAQAYSFAELQSLSKEAIATRHGVVADGSREIMRLLAATHKALKVTKGSKAWREYVAAMSDMVLDGVVTAVQTSGAYLVQQVRVGEAQTVLAWVLTAGWC